MALFLTLDPRVSEFIYKASRLPALAEAGPCSQWVFQEAYWDVVRRARDLLGTNSWERRGGENEGWSRRPSKCEADLTNSWATRQRALEQITPMRGVPSWAEVAGTSRKEWGLSLNAELDCDGRDCWKLLTDCCPCSWMESSLLKRDPTVHILGYMSAHTIWKYIWREMQFHRKLGKVIVFWTFMSVWLMWVGAEGRGTDGKPLVNMRPGVGVVREARGSS